MMPIGLRQLATESKKRVAGMTTRLFGRHRSETRDLISTHAAYRRSGLVFGFRGASARLSLTKGEAGGALCQEHQSGCLNWKPQAQCEPSA